MIQIFVTTLSKNFFRQKICCRWRESGKIYILFYSINIKFIWLRNTIFVDFRASTSVPLFPAKFFELMVCIALLLQVFPIWDYNTNFQAICFNCMDNSIGQNLIKFKNKKFRIGCTIKKDYFNNNYIPKIIIKDVMIYN